jgi:glycosyltransferase involved in cell wall biosynthesis
MMRMPDPSGYAGVSMGNPLVTVCIPTYNGQTYLRECLESVSGQTFPDIEIVAIDDHSSDRTMEILGEYQKKDPRLRVVRNPKNLGLVDNWNRCVELARGEWIKFVFQDDLIAPTCVEKLVSAGEKGFSMVVCRRDIIFDAESVELQPVYRKYQDTFTVEKIFPGATEISPETFRGNVLDYLDYNFIGEPNTVLLRKHVFLRYGGFHPHLIQLCDYEYWIRVAIHTGFTYVPETLATFRVHRDASSVINRTARKKRKDLIDKVLLWHEFTFNPIYKPLRHAASQRRPPIDFLESLARRMDEIRSIAGNGAAGNEGSEKGFRSDWEDILEWYPSLQCVPTGNISRYLRKLQVAKRHIPGQKA